MVLKKSLLMVFLVTPLSSDTGFVNNIRVTETDNAPACTVGQIKVSTGTLTCSGQIATINTAGSSSGGSATPGGSSGQIQYNDAGVFAGSTNTFVTASSVTYFSSVTVRTPLSGGTFTTNSTVGLLDVFLGNSSVNDNRPLFTAGSNQSQSQFIMTNNGNLFIKGIYSASGGANGMGELILGAAVGANRIGTVQTSNNYIDIYNGDGVTGEMLLRTGDAATRDIVFRPQTALTVRMSKTFTTISSSVTISGAGGLDVTYAVKAASFTVGTSSIFTSSFSARAYDGYVLYFSSGTLAANTSVTLSTTSFNASALGIPICSEVENVNTATVSVRIKALTGLPNSFNVYNADIVNAKDFSCMVPGKPN